MMPSPLPLLHNGIGDMTNTEQRYDEMKRREEYEIRLLMITLRQTRLFDVLRLRYPSRRYAIYALSFTRFAISCRHAFSLRRSCAAFASPYAASRSYATILAATRCRLITLFADYAALCCYVARTAARQLHDEMKR